MKLPLEKGAAPSLFELLAYCVVWSAGITGAGVALFLGKIYAAVLIVLVCVGIVFRFKRGCIGKK
jgi:hypothetical protein